MVAAVDFTYRYAHSSAVATQAGSARGLSLATCSASLEHPHFFEGRVAHPRSVSDMLVGLCEVVRTHYFLRVPALLDPVVTSNEAMLRFEGFSGCCGVYARVDLPAASFDSEIRGRGTTNVDFNDPMRAALTRIGDGDEMRLSVGKDAVTLSTSDDAIVEKKVKLPLRWVKSFSEVQAYQRGLRPALSVSAAETRRFIRSLPRTSPPKRPSYLVEAGRGLRLTQRPQRGAVRLVGLHRLRVLSTLAGRATGMRIWADDTHGTSAFQVELDAGRFFLMLSPELYRGFSGEGQLLETLVGGQWEQALPRVRAQLRWQNQLDAAALARDTGLGVEAVEAALGAVGSRGLAGFDVNTGSYFHRELPFDLDQIEALQPRLRGARKLIEAGGVGLSSRAGDDAWDVEVAGTDVAHAVRLRPGDDGGDRCSCPWFSKNQGARGPCKHILAARMALEEPDDGAS